MRLRLNRKKLLEALFIGRCDSLYPAGPAEIRGIT
jgi:hypothetical protein